MSFACLNLFFFRFLDFYSRILWVVILAWWFLWVCYVFDLQTFTGARSSDGVCFIFPGMDIVLLNYLLICVVFFILSSVECTLLVNLSSYAIQTTLLGWDWSCNLWVIMICIVMIWYKFKNWSQVTHIHLFVWIAQRKE